MTGVAEALRTVVGRSLVYGTLLSCWLVFCREYGIPVLGHEVTLFWAFAPVWLTVTGWTLLACLLFAAADICGGIAIVFRFLASRLQGREED